VIHGDGQEANSCAYFPESLDREMLTIRVHNPLLGSAGTQSETQDSGGVPGSIRTYAKAALSLIKDDIKRFIPLLDAYGVWARAATAAAVQEVRQHGNFDAVVSTSFPLSAHVVAMRMKRRTGAVWVADFRDYYGQFASNELRGGAPRDHYLRSFARKVGREADLVTTVSGKLAEIIRGAVAPRRLEILYNGYFEEHVHTDDNASSPRRRILYTGSYNAIEFTIAPLVSALERLREDGFEVPIVCFTGSRIGAVAEPLGAAGLAFEFLGAMGNSSVMRLQRESALLLICDAMSGPGTLPTKSFEYLAARRPILAIARLDSDLAMSLFRKPSPGYLVSMDPSRIADFIRSRLDGQSGSDGDYYDNEMIAAYSRERQADKLLDKIASLVVGKSIA
jgi:hypothetical protein